MLIVDLYVSDKKVKLFNRTGSCEIMHGGVIYRFNKKPENLALARRIAKYQAKIRMLKQQAVAK